MTKKAKTTKKKPTTVKSLNRLISSKVYVRKPFEKSPTVESRKPKLSCSTSNLSALDAALAEVEENKKAQVQKDIARLATSFFTVHPSSGKILRELGLTCVRKHIYGTYERPDAVNFYDPKNPHRFITSHTWCFHEKGWVVRSWVDFLKSAKNIQGGKDETGRELEMHDYIEKQKVLLSEVEAKVAEFEKAKKKIPQALADELYRLTAVVEGENE